MNNRIVLITMEDGLRGTSIRYLSSFLKADGLQPSLLFLRKPRGTYGGEEKEDEVEIDEIKKFINDNNFPYVGFSIMTNHFYRARALTQQIKKSPKDIMVIWGGIHPSLMPKECLDAGADIVVLRDGEVLLKRILSGDNLSEIKGIAYHQNKKLFITETPAEFFLPLDSLPFPDFDFDNAFILDNKKVIPMTIDYYRENTAWNGTCYYLTTTRGCPYRCSFCCNINRDHVRRRSVNNIMEELSYVKSILPFTKGINVQDDSFFLGADSWLEEFCTKLRKQFGWFFIVRLMPKFVTEQRTDILKKGGLRYVDIGLQGSDRLNLEYYNRNENSKAFVEACNILARHGIGYAVDVLLDNPYETKEDIIEIVKTLNEIPKPYKVLLYGLTLFPGTELTERAKKEGMFDKFGTDSYMSSFASTLPGKYMTPIHWCNLINLTSLAPKGIVDRIIRMDIDNLEAQIYINRSFKLAKFVSHFSGILRRRNVFLFNIILAIILHMKKIFIKLRRGPDRSN